MDKILKYHVSGDNLTGIIDSIFLRSTHDKQIISGAFGNEIASVESCVWDSNAVYYKKDRLLVINGTYPEKLKAYLECKFNKVDIELKSIQDTIH